MEGEIKNEATCMRIREFEKGEWADKSTRRRNEGKDGCRKVGFSQWAAKKSREISCLKGIERDVKRQEPRTERKGRQLGQTSREEGRNLDTTACKGIDRRYNEEQKGET
jgi:hypothetical protein